jgi:DNA-binding ferritin-like protein
MMQTNELRQRLSQVESTIHDAARRCESTNGVPMAVKDSMQLLDQRIMQSNDMMQSQDESRIRQYIDDLEQIGDRAKDACEHAPQEMDSGLRDVVMQAHRELSDLKHQLH